MPPAQRGWGAPGRCPAAAVACGHEARRHRRRHRRAGCCLAAVEDPHRDTVRASCRPGFVASSVALADGARVDVPLRVFSPGYYPTLSRLYAELGVATEAVNYATTFTGTDGLAYFRWRNLRAGSLSWPYVLPQDMASIRARRILAGALRFNRLARAALARGELSARQPRRSSRFSLNNFPRSSTSGCRRKAAPTGWRWSRCTRPIPATPSG